MYQYSYIKLHVHTGLKEIHQYSSNGLVWVEWLWKTLSCFSILYNVIWKGIKYYTQSPECTDQNRREKQGQGCCDFRAASSRLHCAHPLTSQSFTSALPAAAFLQGALLCPLQLDRWASTQPPGKSTPSLLQRTALPGLAVALPTGHLFLEGWALLPTSSCWMTSQNQ